MVTFTASTTITMSTVKAAAVVTAMIMTMVTTRVRKVVAVATAVVAATKPTLVVANKGRFGGLCHFIRHT
ncbi:hypothetical protein D3C85_1516540 [compost metagenome]